MNLHKLLTGSDYTLPVASRRSKDCVQELDFFIIISPSNRRAEVTTLLFVVEALLRTHKKCGIMLAHDKIGTSKPANHDKLWLGSIQIKHQLVELPVSLKAV